MASIHKSNKSRFWIAAWRDANGKQYQRSTKLTDHGKAMLFAMEMERAARMADNGGLVEAQARQILGEMLKRVNPDEQLRMPTVDRFLNDWLASKTAAKSQATAARYKSTVQDFLEHLGRRKLSPISGISQRDVQSYLDARLKDGCAPGTAIVDIKTLRAAFGRAVKQGLIPNNPADAVDLPKRKTVERGTFSGSEIALLVNAAHGEMKTLVMLGYYTGQRLGDCLAVTWDAVNFDQGTISVRQGKTDKAVVIPMHPDLRAHLEKLAGDQPGPLMPKLSKVKISGRRGVSRKFLELVNAAGLDAGRAKGFGKRIVNCRSFHALRHSFTSALANAGVAPELRMKLTGHSSERVHAGYSHHELQTLRGVVEKLPSLTSTQPQ